MIKHNLEFFPVWGLEHQFKDRDASIWYQEILLETCQRLIAILAGINKQYFTTFQFKRTHRFINRLEVKPQDFSSRLHALFKLELPEALPNIEALVSETISLVDTHMPQVDTSKAKARLGWKQKPWSLDS